MPLKFDFELIADCLSWFAALLWIASFVIWFGLILSTPSVFEWFGFEPDSIHFVAECSDLADRQKILQVELTKNQEKLIQLQGQLAAYETSYLLLLDSFEIFHLQPDSFFKFQINLKYE